jgi:uncharacterized Zn-binding protein involved in type VI secretion
MSAVESAQQAARLTDPVGHGFGMLGMIGGAILGAVAAALLIAGGIVTGGALIAVVVAGCVAGGGLAGGQLLNGIERAGGLSKPTTGRIANGSGDVFIGGQRAARAEIDYAGDCNGRPMNHFTKSKVAIAEGSATVMINFKPAARVTSKLVCGAEILQGIESVFIGGPTKEVLSIDDNEELLKTGLTWLGGAALVGGGLVAWCAGGAAALLGYSAWTAGGMVGFAGLGWIGDQIGPGWGDILQGSVGLLLLGGAGWKGWRGMQAKRAQQPIPGLKETAKIDAKLDPEYVGAVAKFKNSTPEEVKAFYERMVAQGIDHRVLIENALEKYPALTRAEAEAIYGYTTKQWYRDFNRILENGGTPEAEQLSGLLSSGVEKMPNSTSATQYRGVRLNTPEDLAKFDAKFAEGEVIVTKSFWSTGPDPSNAYSAQRSLVIKTESAKDISELAFGVHYHEMIGKTPYISETIIPPGVKFKVAQVDADGTVFLEELK